MSSTSRRRRWPERVAITLLLVGVSGLASAQPPVGSPPSVRPSPNICLAGTGSFGWCGDGRRATLAKLAGPSDVAGAPDGSLVIADTFNQIIRRIDPQGRISTIAGAGARGSAKHDVSAQRARFRYPRGVAVDVDGSVLVADTGNAWIRRINSVGRVIAFAHEGLVRPTDVAVLPDGDYAVADPGADRVLRVSPEGDVVPLAGDGIRGFAGDGGRGIDARLDRPSAVALSTTGLLIADTGNGVVRQLGLDGTITTVAGAHAGAPPGATPATQLDLAAPQGVAGVAGGGFVFTDASRVWLVSSAGAVDRLAGTRPAGFNGDRGAARSTRLDHPGQLAAATDGAFLVVDSGNDRIRRLAPDGSIATVAGSGRPDARLARVIRAPFKPKSSSGSGGGGPGTGGGEGGGGSGPPHLKRHSYPRGAVQQRPPDCGVGTTQANLLKIRPYSADVVKAKAKKVVIAFGVTVEAKVTAYAWRAAKAYGKRSKKVGAGTPKITLGGALPSGKYFAVVVGRASGSGDKLCDARAMKVG